MRIRCNKYWATVDAPKTVMLECAVQYVRNKGLDAFLGVELTVRTRHPLCFAVAHKHHGKQMRTGWKVQHPRSLDDYDADQSKILLESQLSSLTNFCYAKGTYQAMLDDIVSISDVTDMGTRSKSSMNPRFPRALHHSAMSQWMRSRTSFPKTRAMTKTTMNTRESRHVSLRRLSLFFHDLVRLMADLSGRMSRHLYCMLEYLPLGRMSLTCCAKTTM